MNRCSTKDVVESFARNTLNFFGFCDWGFEWDFEKCWCDHELKKVFLWQEFRNDLVCFGKEAVLHEITHIIVYPIEAENGGHGVGFWKTFAYLLDMFSCHLSAESSVLMRWRTLK